MLSKTEREFLQGSYKPSASHKRFLRYKIKKKLREFYQFELPLLQNTNVSEFTNTSLRDVANKSLGRGTNPRPNAYETLNQTNLRYNPLSFKDHCDNCNLEKSYISKISSQYNITSISFLVHICTS